MMFVLMGMMLLLAITSLIVIDDLEKRITNSISYVETLKVKGQILNYEGTKLQNILRGDN